MEIKVQKRNDALVISVNGRIDATNSVDFENTVKGFVKDWKNNVVLDFSALEYISSAGLRSILSIAKQLKSENRDLMVACLKNVVKQVFEISGFSKIIPVYESVDLIFSGK